MFHKMTINEPKEYFNYGKTPMYFVIVIVGICAIGLLAFTIRNFKKNNIEDKRYILEEKQKLIQQNMQNNQNT